MGSQSGLVSALCPFSAFEIVSNFGFRHSPTLGLPRRPARTAPPLFNASTLQRRQLVPMRSTPAAAAAATPADRAAVHGASRHVAAGAGVAGGRGREDRELFIQLGGAAMRAFGPLPIRRTDQDFAILFALFAMKLVNRHGTIIIRRLKSSSHKRFQSYCRLQRVHWRFRLGIRLWGVRPHFLNSN